MRVFYYLFSLVVSSALFLPCSCTGSPYEVPKEFMDLFYDFSGSSRPGFPKGKVNASQALINSRKDKPVGHGPLILAVKSNVYVYSEKGKLLLNYPLRASRSNGFFEMTAISHVGPAIAYYLKAKENGSKEWESGLKSLLKSLKTVQKLNRSHKNHWLDRVEAPSWRPFKGKIRNMVDYACSLSGHYISGVLAGKPYTQQTLIKDYYERSDKEYPVPFNHVMVGTFMLTVLEGIYSMNKSFADLNLDWTKAKVLVRIQAGSNITAGLTAGSNWLVPVFHSLSKDKLPERRLFVAPYLEVKSDLGSDNLSKESFEYYRDKAWGSTYSRGQISSAAFSFIPSMYVPSRPSLPGDYTETKANEIDDFIVRLKYSLVEETQMLSNTVAFWMAKEFTQKKGDLSKIDIPGLTTGFEKFGGGYPKDNPEIK